MNDLFAAFSNSLIALALCIAVGFFCRRRHMLNDIHVSGMTGLLVKVAMPATVFMSLMRPFSTELLLEGVAAFFITGAVFLTGGFIGMALARALRASQSEGQAWRFGLTFGNVGFMGIPVIYAVFGYEGMFYVAMANAAFNLLTFTIGIRMFDTEKTVKVGVVSTFVNNPALPATVIGIVFFLTGIRLPTALEGGVNLIHSLTSPISMILIGALLAKQRLKDTFMDRRVLPPNAVKLLVLPLITWLALRWIIPNPVMLGVIVTLMAMPPAASTAIFAEQFGKDADAAVRLVIVGTILCIATVPLVSLLL